MDRLRTITTCDFDDACYFLESLRELEKDPNTICRGMANAGWPLLPTACRNKNFESPYLWTVRWIDTFVDTNVAAYVEFCDYQWENESANDFKIRFELALRDYVQKDIEFRFQEIAQSTNVIDLTPEECVPAVSETEILDYLSARKPPLVGQVKYASLLAQHHGVPTRLLDWTSSLDVALDFATSAVTDPDLPCRRIVVWVMKELTRRIPSADLDCDEQHLNIVLTSKDQATNYLLMESPVHGTCLKLFQPVEASQADFSQPLSSAGSEKEREPHTYRVKLDQVSEVYVDSQHGKAMIDMWHDRHVYKYRSCQSFEARLSDSPIQAGRVFKFTLPYAEVPRLQTLLGPRSVTQCFSTEVYEQFEDYNSHGDMSEKERLHVRKRNFLHLIGKKVRRQIDWNSLSA